jgi:hypothetical protein
MEYCYQSESSIYLAKPYADDDLNCSQIPVLEQPIKHNRTDLSLNLRQGYSLGCDAPGRSSTNGISMEGDSATEPWIVGHCLILAHAKAARLYNKEFKSEQKGLIGAAINGDFFLPWNASDPKDCEAAERRMEFWIGWFANPML